MDLARKFARVASLAPKSEIDQFAMNKLRSAYIEYRKKKGSIASKFKLYVNGKKYETFYDAFVLVDSPDEIYLKFYGHERTGWKFDVPVVRMKISGGGVGAVEYYKRKVGSIEGGFVDEKVKTMAGFRVWVEHGYIPQSIKSYSKYTEEPKWPSLMQVKDLWAFIRERGAIPFKMRVCAYTNEGRITFHLDLTENAQLRDFRSSIISDGALRKIDPLYYLYLDRALSSHLIPELQKKILEVVFESKGMSAGDIAVIFNITERMANNHLKGLVRRGLLKVEGKPPMEQYVADFESLQKTKGIIKE
ncbi:MAG: hypothetical protein DRN20_05175 [Thermoplasmata archaeon]|mgnify:CR=1 FL=1|nr:MAG: hypothetical protein DRN20_05175 [Thermoplasmata archaeon]